MFFNEMNFTATRNFYLLILEKLNNIELISRIMLLTTIVFIVSKMRGIFDFLVHYCIYNSNGIITKSVRFFDSVLCVWLKNSGFEINECTLYLLKLFQSKL